MFFWSKMSTLSLREFTHYHLISTVSSSWDLRGWGGATPSRGGGQPEAEPGTGNLKCGLVSCHGNIFSSEFKYLKVKPTEVKSSKMQIDTY